MKKVNTAAAKQSKNLSQQKLTIRLDLGPQQLVLQLHISKEGDPYLWTLLVQRAQHILGPFGVECDLRRSRPPINFKPRHYRTKLGNCRHQPVTLRIPVRPF